MYRVLIATDPEIDNTDYLYDNSPWSVQWIGPAIWNDDTPAVYAFRRVFELNEARTVRVHVSADERYRLFVDGQPVGRGPERGEARNWFYESYDLPFAAGKHVIVARVWRLGNAASFAQMSVRPAFFLLAEGESGKLLSTGVGDWQFRQLDGYSFTPRQMTQTFMTIGAASNIHGDTYDFGHHTGDGSGWQPAPAIARAVVKSLDNEQPPGSLALRPAVLPPMLDRPLQLGVVRAIVPADSLDLRALPIEQAAHLAEEADHWTTMLAGHGTVMIPAKTGRRVIIDLQNYYCVYPHFHMSGGRGVTVQHRWAESLIENQEQFAPDEHRLDFKGDRNIVFGKWFNGVGGSFYPEGMRRTYDTLWWYAGRYIELTIITAEEPLLFDAIIWNETHFPYQFESSFDASDPRLTQLIPVALRTLEMCSHETYYDCPYFEQLMYVGDTRIEVLMTYVSTRSDALPRKAIELFDESRDATGLTRSRTPSRTKQRIPPFSLWWVAMLHDFAMWREDRAFVAARLPGARAVINAYLQHRRDDGLVVSPPGWNFVDWVPGWKRGMHKDAHLGPSGPLNLQLIWQLRQLAELEDAAGEPELAIRCRRYAAELNAAVLTRFYDPDRGLFADDLDHTSFSEHAQCMAILGSAVDGQHRARVIEGLLNDKNLFRATIYYSHYLFEACTAIGRVDCLFDRLPLWFELVSKGLKTTVESPEPTRSDCHAWGAHPLFHYYASILGIRPTSMGFKSVTIRPQLGPLEWAKGSMVHPAGMIDVHVRRSGEVLSCDASLPPGVKGVLIINGRKTDITPR